MDEDNGSDAARYEERLMVHSELGAEIFRKDAEIAKLRAERDEAKRCLHVEMSMRKDAEVLPTETGTGPWRVVPGHDGASAVRHDDGRFWFNSYFQASIAVDVASLLNRAESLTAALDGERAKCDEWRAKCRDYRGGGFDNDGKKYLVLCPECKAHDDRRAAEAQPKENQS